MNMENFDLKAYQPIDYQKWLLGEQAREGANIKHLFTREELTIWNKAQPYQDSRNDPGHAEFVTYFALQLLKILGGKREIIVPAAILHDIGWSQMEWEFNIQKVNQREVRLKHEKIGAKLAREILSKLNYKLELVEETGEIILGHDTRDNVLSLNDGIVKDADKLWRFTLTHFAQVMIGNFGLSSSAAEQKLESYFNKKSFFHSDAVKKIARIEFNNTLERYNKRQGEDK